VFIDSLYIICYYLRNLLNPSFYSELPSCAHQVDELLSREDLSGDCGVVVAPLLVCEFADVAEGCQEGDKDVVIRHLTGENLGVPWALEGRFEVRNLDATLTVHVKFVESALDDLCSLSVGLSSDAGQKLVKVDEAVLRGVKVSQKNASLALGDRAVKVLKTPVELLLIKLTVTVHIKHLELFTQASHSYGAACEEFALYFVED
jgi:hypothetical protein